MCASRPAAVAELHYWNVITAQCILCLTFVLVSCCPSWCFAGVAERKSAVPCTCSVINSSQRLIDISMTCILWNILKWFVHKTKTPKQNTYTQQYDVYFGHLVANKRQMLVVFPRLEVTETATVTQITTIYSCAEQKSISVIIPWTSMLTHFPAAKNKHLTFYVCFSFFLDLYPCLLSCYQISKNSSPSPRLLFIYFY